MFHFRLKCLAPEAIPTIVSYNVSSVFQREFPALRKIYNATNSLGRFENIFYILGKNILALYNAGVSDVNSEVALRISS
jgi:hypothetical protein